MREQCKHSQSIHIKVIPCEHRQQSHKLTLLGKLCSESTLPVPFSLPENNRGIYNSTKWLPCRALPDSGRESPEKVAGASLIVFQAGAKMAYLKRGS